MDAVWRENNINLVVPISIRTVGGQYIVIEQ